MLGRRLMSASIAGGCEDGGPRWDGFLDTMAGRPHGAIRNNAEYKLGHFGDAGTVESDAGTAAGHCQTAGDMEAVVAGEGRKGGQRTGVQKHDGMRLYCNEVPH